MACLAGASVTLRVQLFGVLRASVYHCDCIHKAWQDFISDKESKSKMNDRDYQHLQHRTAAAKVTANLNIHLEDLVSIKTDHRELHKANIHKRAATDKPLITDTNAKMQQTWC
uniref:Uncharacterized protein n=1 Tax=Cyprinus carpio TaxID=7962 RepID=A0A8C2LAS9_CYPCA